MPRRATRRRPSPASWVSTSRATPLAPAEVNAAAPLINALLREHPRRRVLVTTITPTGSDRVRALWGTRVAHVYLPYDLTGAVGRTNANGTIDTTFGPNGSGYAYYPNVAGSGAAPGARKGLARCALAG